MLILLINLARRPDRLAFMQSQLDALELPFERIDAVDGKAVDLGPGTDLITPVELACALSHRKAWAHFLDSGENVCLILEDDVLIAPQAKGLIDDPNHLPPDAEIVRLETGLQTSLLGYGRPFGLAGYRLHRLYSRHHGCAAYMVSRAFAARAVRDLTSFAEPLDDLLFQSKSPNFFRSVRYQIRPGLCLQADLYEPTAQSLLARSNLQEDRAVRVYGSMPPRLKVTRSLPEKCVREVQRWYRRSKRVAVTLVNLVLLRRAMRHIPFSGPVLPVALNALSRPGQEPAS